MLSHPWLNMEDNYNFKYTKAEHDKIQFKKSMQKDGGKIEEEANK